MPLCHGWAWQQPQTASHIHIKHMQTVLAHWVVVHWHTVAALHSFTHPTLLRFWGSGLLVESKWCDYVMVEADSHLKLLPASISNIRKCLSTLVCCLLAYSCSLTQFYPPYLAQILGFWVTCGVKMMSFCHGLGWQPPQTASHIHIQHIKCFSILISCPRTYSISLTQLYPHYLAQIIGFWVTGGVKMMRLCHGWGWQPPQTASHIHTEHI